MGRHSLVNHHLQAVGIGGGAGLPPGGAGGSLLSWSMDAAFVSIVHLQSEMTVYSRLDGTGRSVCGGGVGATSSISARSSGA